MESVKLSRWSAHTLCAALSVLCMNCGQGQEPQSPFEVGVVQSALAIENVASTKTVASGLWNGLKTSLLRAATTDDYLHGFTMEEKSDDPCKFYALFNAIDDNALHGNETWNECDGSSGNFKTDNMGAVFRTTGLALCLNGDKMKGFALIGRYPECILDPNGTTPLGGACNGRGPRHDAVEERDNCPGSKNGIDSDWEAIVECPEGSVVTGIEINHISSAGNRRMMNGAKAICHPLLP